ncbi:sensor histidine kinase [Paraferrimonas sedimenticola]|uniref:histidine kinase n=1 Tax=Paraferrimonas sedimenticola TaxID=375674 RepID=A0AA37W0G4_9GAMM|nr:ATP-binding protein [Paraferrimonas sedimenticola]GLP94977.1 sensor histidine kinase [Paraferrimonas sedimenticola]
MSRVAEVHSGRYDALLQAMPSGIIILDANGVVIEANPSAANLLDDPLVGQRWIHIIQRDFAPQADDGHEVSLKNGRRVQVAMTPLEQENGQMIVLTDLTETRELQRNMAHMERLSALGKMMASLAHQVRTPLSAALLYASNLGNPGLNPQSQQKFQGKLVDRLNELESQVNDMLMFARSPSQPLADMSLNAAVQQSIESVDAHAQRNQCEIAFKQLTSAQIQGNSNALSSAIGNLLMNAMEAKATRIELRLEQRQSALVLSVLDNGQGMGADTQLQAVQPFYTTKSQGTGLGLAVVQSVMRNHQGSVQIGSLENQGCLVELSFPLPSQQAVINSQECVNG